MIICSSVNRVFFMTPSLFRGRPSLKRQLVRKSLGRSNVHGAAHTVVWSQHGVQRDHPSRLPRPRHLRSLRARAVCQLRTLSDVLGGYLLGPPGSGLFREHPSRRGGPVRRCCMNRHWPARCPPTGFLPADAIRRWSAEVGHPIEDFAAEDDLTPLPGWAPGAKTSADDGLVSEERVLHPALTMVP